MKTRRSRPTHRLAAAAAICVSSASADWNPPSRYGPVPANAGADMGRTAALDGDWAAAGARRFGTSPNQAGGVFVFHRDAGAWSSVGVLQAGDRTASDEFGASVALSGGQLAAGAPFDDPRGTNSGSAYVFSLVGGVWSQTARLVPSDGQAVDLFGTAVGLADGWLLCGAPLDDDSGIDAGSVYAFHDDGAQWVQVAKFTPGAVGDQFGTAISSSADAAAVGSPFDDDVATDAGTVYVYRRSGDAWAIEAILHASDGAGGDRFGSAVALAGDLLIVGAPRDDRAGAIDHGSAYIFRRENGAWVEEAKLMAADAFGGDFFGVSVAIQGDAALIGSNFDDDRGTNSGSAYLFERLDGVWIQTQKWVAADGLSQDWFGSAVALGADEAIVGAPGADLGADAAGAAYLYTFVPSNQPPVCALPDSAQVECQGADTQIGLDGSGASDPDQDALRYHWSVDRGEAYFNDPDAMMPTLHINAGGACAFDCRVMLTVSDGRADPVSCEMVVRVVDTSPPVLVSSGDLHLEAGQPWPAADEIAPQVSDCDPNLDLSYTDRTTRDDCASSPANEKVFRTWTTTDQCGNAASVTQMIQRDRFVLPMDIKPGDCANAHNARSSGVLKIALLGIPELGGATVDVAGVRLRRADCLGGEVSVSAGEEAAEWEDSATPAAQRSCACPSDKADGLMDVTLRFDSRAIESAMNLSSLAGTQTTLSITGRISAPGTPLDGLEFIAADCINLVPGSKPPGEPSHGGHGSRVEPEDDPAPSPINDSVTECGAGLPLALPLMLAGLACLRTRSRWSAPPRR